MSCGLVSDKGGGISTTSEPNIKGIHLRCGERRHIASFVEDLESDAEILKWLKFD
jgi:hypothetical protein